MGKGESGGSGGLVVVSTTGSSVEVEMAVVGAVVGGRTVVKVSAGTLDDVLRVPVAALVELLLELVVLVLLSGEEAPGQSSSTRLPARTCPSTVVSGASTPSHTASTFRWIRVRPRTHSGEHVFPSTKSLMVQPGISVL